MLASEKESLQEPGHKTFDVIKGKKGHVKKGISDDWGQHRFYCPITRGPKLIETSGVSEVQVDGSDHW